jgi:osmoprotectant transport system ATP-binding protein
MPDASEAAAAEVLFAGVELVRSGRDVLRGVDLSIAPGETVALVGRSGVGKSSLLKLINRMLLPDRGRVSVRGKDTRDWNEFDLRRQTGYVLQEIGLFPHLSVGENVVVVPRLLGWSDERIARTAAEMLNLVGLPPEEYASRPPHELSGGERQRVGVARALAADPPLLLMDEPFGALDPITRSELHRQFLGIQERLRKTVVIVTHDMAEALTLAGRIAVISDGRPIAVETPRAIINSADPRIRSLLSPLLEAGAVLRGYQ